MNSIAWKTVVAGMMSTAVTLSVFAQPPEGGTRRKGADIQSKKGLANSKKGSAASKGQMQGRGGFPAYKVGSVIPPFMVGQLDLSEEQQAEIEKLEADVAKKLKGILNEEQFQALSQPPQMGPGGPGGPPGGPGGFGPRGGRGFGPGGGPDGEEGAPPQKSGRGRGEARKKPAPPVEDQ